MARAGLWGIWDKGRNSAARFGFDGLGQSKKKASQRTHCGVFALVETQRATSLRSQSETRHAASLPESSSHFQIARGDGGDGPVRFQTRGNALGEALLHLVFRAANGVAARDGRALGE